MEDDNDDSSRIADLPDFLLHSLGIHDSDSPGSAFFLLRIIIINQSCSMFINTTHKLLTPPKKYLMSSGEYSTVAAEAEAEAEAGVSNQGQQSFPLKLHSMLNDATSKGFDGIISWNPDGCSFKIHQPAEFNDR